MKVNITAQATVELPVQVQARPNWAFSAPDPTRLGNGLPNGCVTLTANSPVPGAGGDGKFHGCIDWDFTLSDIEEIADNGPNHGLNWVTAIRDLTTADWVMHPDVDNPSSDWSQHQCGNWSPINSACLNPQGTGFISAADYAAGIERHESGPANSHYADFKWAFETPSNNLKNAAESQVGPVVETKAQFLAFVVGQLDTKRTAVINAYTGLPEPCSQTCDGTCTTTMGFANTKASGSWYLAVCPI